VPSLKKLAVQKDKATLLQVAYDGPIFVKSLRIMYGNTQESDLLKEAALSFTSTNGQYFAQDDVFLGFCRERGDIAVNTIKALTATAIEALTSVVVNTSCKKMLGPTANMTSEDGSQSLEAFSQTLLLLRLPHRMSNRFLVVCSQI